MPVTLTYEHKRIRCGKPRCHCASPYPDHGHGPYWYAFFTDPTTKKTRARYLGKHITPPEPGPGARSQRVSTLPTPGALRRRRSTTVPYLKLDKTSDEPKTQVTTPARQRARAAEARERREDLRARERAARREDARRRIEEAREKHEARERARAARQEAKENQERCRRERARVGRFTPTPCEGYQRVCYVHRNHALRAFVASNLDVTEPWGLDQKASGGEFDSVNERHGLRGKRRVTTLAQAIDKALPPGRPYCLDRLDLEVLNETTPGREFGPFRLPEVVEEHKAYQSYMKGLGEAHAYRDEQERHDVQVPF